MRLIDADALHCNFFDYTPLEYVWNRGDVEHKINEMPTIDAIPVEWLKGLMLSTEDDVDKGEFDWILREWESEQKEMEAR